MLLRDLNCFMLKILNENKIKIITVHGEHKIYVNYDGINEIKTCQ